MLSEAPKALFEALRAIPQGQISATAKRSGIPLRALNRLREGKRLDVRISTLLKLTRGMQKSADELIGVTKPDPNAITGSVHVSGGAALKVRKKLERIAADVNALVGSLPEGVEQPKPRK